MTNIMNDERRRTSKESFARSNRRRAVLQSIQQVLPDLLRALFHAIFNARAFCHKERQERLEDWRMTANRTGGRGVYLFRSVFEAPKSTGFDIL